MGVYSILTEIKKTSSIPRAVHTVISFHCSALFAWLDMPRPCASLSCALKLGEVISPC